MTTIEFNNQLVNLQPNLERFANSLTGDSEKAQDLVQETYLKAFSNRDKFVHYSNLKAWAFTILKNTFINEYRRNTKRRTKNDDTKELYYINQTDELKNVNPDSKVSFNEINEHIDSLSDKYRKPFIMHLIGYKYKEIAHTLNLKIGTVKSRIFFGRKLLMEQLNDYYE